jgi:hypothetical protein
MKQRFVSVGLAVAMLYTIGCERNILEKKGSEQTYFPTQQEAANKAKSDLLAVLRSRKEIALGFEQQTIEKSQPAAPITRYQITFEDLASASTFATLNRNELATVVPLVADDTVATIVEVTKDESGWRTSSIADKSLSSELDVVRKVAGPQSGIIIYDLPHSGTRVYGVTQPAGAEPSAALLYTNYTGFDLRERVPADRLLPVLKQDAAEFQRLYGEDLKSRKLVR